jgi:hypothetical protein
VSDDESYKAESEPKEIELIIVESSSVAEVWGRQE